MRSAIALGLAVATLAGCRPLGEVPEFEVPTSRVYEQDRQAVWQDVITFLDGADITVVQQDLERGLLLATREDFEDVGWAWCERRWVRDRDRDRRRRARPVDRDLALEVEVRALDGATEVEVASDFTEEQIDTFRNRALTQQCLSTGVLERELLAAVES